MAEENTPTYTEMPVLKPATFSRDQMLQIVDTFKDTDQGAATVVAKTLAGEVGQDAPGLFTYESLRDGTAPFFDFSEQYKGVAPNNRALTDEEIISIFAVDTEGNPIMPGEFQSGFMREIIPQGLSLAGGFKGGQKLMQVAPKHPYVQAGAGVVGFLGGMFAGGKAGEVITDVTMGEERPHTPGQTAAYEQGKTAAGVVGWLPLPFMVSPKITFGAAAYLDNLAKEGIEKGPRAMRFLRGSERLLGKVGQGARDNKAGTIVGESALGAGAVFGAGAAETQYPNEPLPRIGYEFLGSGGGMLLGAPLTTLVENFDGLKTGFRSLSDQYRAGGAGQVLNPVKQYRQGRAVTRILEILEEAGEDPKAIIERLEASSLNGVLLDEAGNPIKLTAGAKSGSPALLAIEKSLDQLGMGLGKERTAGAKSAISALRTTILALSNSDEQAALQAAADISESVFRANLDNNLRQATDRVVTAFENIAPGKESNIQLSEKLYDVVSNQMELARRQEKQLWNNVPNVEITSFVDEAGEATNVPNFITVWENTFATAPQRYRDKYMTKLKYLGGFVDDKKADLGLLTDTDGNPIPPTGNLTTKDLTYMRSLALDEASEAMAAGNRKSASIAYQMADALLRDLGNVPPEPGQQNFRAAYDQARVYSKALNDTFTRAFAGDALETTTDRGLRIAPELLANRLLQGGNDPTYLRVQQINDIGTFQMENGIEGAEQTVATLRGVQESILRNARAEAFNPETGKISLDSLQKWMGKNKDILATFPALRDDLLDAEKAAILLNDTSQAAKMRQAEEAAQVSFYDIMNPVMGDGRRLHGTESPTTAITKAINSKAPYRNLNRILDLVESTPDEALREQAMRGLRSTVMEWAGTKAGLSSSGTFSPTVLYQQMFKPLKGSKSDLSLMDWMVENQVMGKQQSNSLREFLTEMVRFEAAEVDGSIGELVDRAGPILDFYLAISGSAIGTRMQKVFTGGSAGPGAITAASKGADTMRNIFADIPAALQTDVMSEIMRNPELLAAMMRKPRTDAIGKRLRGYIGDTLKKGGFKPVRSILPGTGREIREEVDQMLAPDAFAPPSEQQNMPSNNQQGALNPPVQTPTKNSGPALGPVNPPPAAVKTASQGSGPVDRTKFAALFPEDRELLGIGSLMGQV